jgi:hypothetical protein
VDPKTPLPSWGIFYTRKNPFVNRYSKETASFCKETKNKEPLRAVFVKSVFAFCS